MTVPAQQPAPGRAGLLERLLAAGPRSSSVRLWSRRGRETGVPWGPGGGAKGGGGGHGGGGPGGGAPVFPAFFAGKTGGAAPRNAHAPAHGKG